MLQQPFTQIHNGQISTLRLCRDLNGEQKKAQMFLKGGVLKSRGEGLNRTALRLPARPSLPFEVFFSLKATTENLLVSVES